LGHGPEIGPKTGPHSIAKITTRATGGHYGEADAAACASQARPISPNVLDLGNEFMGMREAFLNLAQ
jgi:hypothetical protein